MSEVLLQARNITKIYNPGEGELKVLRGLGIDIFKRDSIGIVGASGSGKSTFLHILGTLDRPTEGEVYFEGLDLFKKGDEELAKFRNQKMGFVFQFHHLIAEMNMLENVALPARIGGMPKSEAEDRAMVLLSFMGLRERSHHFSNELSGGELQRASIARALVLDPTILFADEPTGNLDSTNSIMIQDLFLRLREERGLTLIVVTHDPGFARKFQRIYHLKDGQWENTSSLTRDGLQR
ncbi:MAG: ABC transporter ATP-binding protein [Bdellovibrionota bacterium]